MVNPSECALNGENLATAPNGGFSISFSCPIVHEPDCDWTPRHGTTEASGEGHGRAPIERSRDRIVIDVCRLWRGVRAFIGDARRADDFPVAPEAKSDRHLHTGARFVVRRWNPTGAQCVEHVGERA
jgi:hypothetical protein